MLASFDVFVINLDIYFAFLIVGLSELNITVPRK